MLAAKVWLASAVAERGEATNPCASKLIHEVLRTQQGPSLLKAGISSR